MQLGPIFCHFVETIWVIARFLPLPQIVRRFDMLLVNKNLAENPVVSHLRFSLAIALQT